VWARYLPPHPTPTPKALDTFKNLEALQKRVAASSGEGFEVRRITVTCPDGQEVY